MIQNGVSLFKIERREEKCGKKENSHETIILSCTVLFHESSVLEPNSYTPYKSSFLLSIDFFLLSCKILYMCACV